MQKEIEITIDQLGRPKIEAIGYNGMGCTQATEALEKALNGKSDGKQRHYKPEATKNTGTIKGRV